MSADEERRYSSLSVTIQPPESHSGPLPVLRRAVTPLARVILRYANIVTRHFGRRV